MTTRGAAATRREALHPGSVPGPVSGGTPRAGAAFSATTAIDPGTLYGVASLDEAMQLMASVRKVTRAQAMTVPAVIAARDRITALGQLPLKLHGPDNAETPWAFFAAPVEGRTGSHSWTQIIDDLLFSGRAFLHPTYVGWHGYPEQGVRLDPESVSVQAVPVTYTTATATGVSWEYPHDPGLIRIDSPKDPLLVAGARAIRVLLRLESAALNAADGVPPNDYFTPNEVGDPFADLDEVEAFLDSWEAARRQRSTAYIPAAVKYETNGWNPEQLQLAEARNMAIAEIGRLTGLDGEDLNVSTTSRTYFNAQDRRRVFLDFVGAPFLRAIEARLSEDDVTPPGHCARFDLSGFLSPDDLTRAQTDEIDLRSGALVLDEVRGRRNLAPLDTPSQEETPADV